MDISYTEDEVISVNKFLENIFILFNNLVFFGYFYVGFNKTN